MQDHPELSCLCQVDAGGHCISKVSRVRWYGEELSHWTSIDTEYEQGYPFDHWYFGVVCNWNTTYPILIDLFIGIRESSCCRPPTCSFSLFFGFGFKDNRKQAKTPKLTFGVFFKNSLFFFLTSLLLFMLKHSGLQPRWTVPCVLHTPSVSFPPCVGSDSEQPLTSQTSQAQILASALAVWPWAGHLFCQGWFSLLWTGGLLSALQYEGED